MTSKWAWSTAAMALWLAAPVAAQADPNTTDTTSQMISEEKPKEDTTKKGKVAWTLNAGANIHTGNTEAWGINAGSNFNWKRSPHELDINYLFNYGRTDLNAGAGYQTNVKNSILQLRYNHWFTDNDAVYVGYLYRWDTLAGLDARVRVDAGYLRRLWSNDVHALKGEVGMAYIYDNRIDGTVPEIQHNASLRLFLGYAAQFNEHVRLTSGLEFLDNVNQLNESPTDIDPFKDVRVNWDANLSAALWEKLALQFSFLLRYDAKPVPGAKKTDTTTLVSLVYTLL